MPHTIRTSQGRLRIRFYAGNIEYLNGQVQHIAFPDGRLVAEYDENNIVIAGYRAEYAARAEIPSRVSYYADSIRRIKPPF